MEKIKSLRKQIDEIDEKILQALKERVELCQVIGAIKKERGIAVKDSARENEVYKLIDEKATRLGLNEAQVELVYRKIIAMCMSAQESDAKT